MAISFNRIVRSLTCGVLVFVALIFIISTANVVAQGPYAYISNSFNNTISVIDTQTNTVTATIPVGISPGGVAISPDGTRIYVTHYVNGNISVIDATTNTVTAIVHVGINPGGVAVSPDGSRIYVADHYNNDVYVIDATTNNVTAIVPVRRGPSGVAVNPSGTGYTWQLPGTIHFLSLMRQRTT